jgi:hypothetical protein
MADIDSIISGVSGNTRADFSGLSNLPDAYRKGIDFAYQQKMRSLYSDENGGLPRDKDGNVDTSKMYERLIQAGGAPAIDSADKLINSGLTQARIRFAPQAGETLSSADQPPAATPGGFPPSGNRGGTRPESGQPQAAAPAQGSLQGDKPGSLMGFLSNWGVPDELAGSEMNILGGKLSAALGRRIDPNQPLDMNDQKIRGILGDWVRSRDGRAPNAAPSAAPAAPGPDGSPNFNARFAGGPSGQPPQPQPIVGPATGRNSVSIDPTQRADMGVSRPQSAPQSYGGPVQAGPAGPEPVQQMQPGAPQPMQPAPQMQPQGQPPATPSAPVAGDDAQTMNLRRAAGTLEKVLASGRLLPEAAKAYEAKLQSIYKQLEPTNDIKNATASRQTLPQYQQSQSDMVAAQAGASEDAKTYVAKFHSLIDIGIKSEESIPQLEMLKEMMGTDKNFYSGIGEKYNYAYKQLKSAMGMDPNAAVPQEFMRKTMAANVLGGIGALRGLGQIRNQEISLTKDASAAPPTSIPANMLLTEVSIRTHQRNSDIADEAQKYAADHDGTINAGFYKIMKDYGKNHPLFTDAEIKDWRLAIGQAANEGRGAAIPRTASANTASTFGKSPEDQQAIKAELTRRGALK